MSTPGVTPLIEACRHRELLAASITWREQQLALLATLDEGMESTHGVEHLAPGRKELDGGGGGDLEPDHAARFGSDGSKGQDQVLPCLLAE
jgi:hypothetical protein